MSALWLVGCASEVSRLPSDAALPDCKRLQALDQTHATKECRVKVTEPDGRVFEMAVHESTGAKSTRRIVFVHGVIADSRLWRYMRGDLAQDFPTTSIDLLGCGRSDVPALRDLPAGHAPDQHARRVLQALRRRLGTYPTGTRLTLVGHSLGGSIILRMYADEELRRQYADVLSKVDSAVLFTPADVEILTEVKNLSAFAEMSDQAMWLAIRSRILDARVARGSVESVADPRLATREEAMRFMEVLEDPPRRHAAQAMIQQAVPKAGRKADLPAIRRVVAGYAQVRIPVMIAWGECDDVLPVSMGYKLAAQLPKAELRVIPDGMHSVPVDYPMVSAKLVREVVAGH